MGRGDQAHVDLAVPHVAQAPEAQVLHDLQQLGLHLQVHVADLVEEERAAVGHLQEAGLGRDRPRERALLVAEELASPGARGESPAQLRSTNGSSARGPVLVEPAGEDALAACPSRPG